MEPGVIFVLSLVYLFVGFIVAFCYLEEDWQCGIGLFLTIGTLYPLVALYLIAKTVDKYLREF